MNSKSKPCSKITTISFSDSEDTDDTKETLRDVVFDLENDKMSYIDNESESDSEVYNTVINVKDFEKKLAEKSDVLYKVEEPRKIVDASPFYTSNESIKSFDISKPSSYKQSLSYNYGSQHVLSCLNENESASFTETSNKKLRNKIQVLHSTSRISEQAKLSTFAPRLTGSILRLNNTGSVFVNGQSNKRVVINVGGIRFETYASTLKLVPESRLANLSETNSDYDPEKKEYFFDRHPGAFVAILNFYRTGKLHAPADICGNSFYEELNFWGIVEHSIEPCCWSNYSQQRDADEALKEVVEGMTENEDIEEADFYDQNNSNFTRSSTREDFINVSDYNRYLRQRSFFKTFYFRCRHKVWRFFEDRNSSPYAKAFYWISVAVLTLSIINFVFCTTPYFRVPYEISNNNSLVRSEKEANTQPHEVLKIIEILCNTFFSIELLLRFLASPNKIKFMTDPYNIVEFLAISPFFFPTQSVGKPKTLAVRIHNYLEVFYILRILRIFSLVPKYSGLRVLLLTVKTSLGELFLYGIVLSMTLMLFASFIFYAEQINEVEDNKFDSILIGLWWAIVTITTLGYGDIVPVTPLGRIVGGFCALCGLIFLALPIPIIVSNFTTYYTHAKSHQKLKAYVDDRKGLLNRALAVHFHQSPDSIGKTRENHSDTENDETVTVKDSCVQTTIRNVDELKALDSKSSSAIPLVEHTERQNKNRAKNLLRKARSKKVSGTMRKWKNCERRTIRRNAIYIDDGGGKGSLLKPNYDI